MHAGTPMTGMSDTAWGVCRPTDESPYDIRDNTTAMTQIDTSRNRHSTVSHDRGSQWCERGVSLLVAPSSRRRRDVSAEEMIEVLLHATVSDITRNRLDPCCVNSSAYYCTLVVL